MSLKPVQIIDKDEKEADKTRIEVFIRIRPCVEEPSCIESIEEDEKYLIIKKDFEQRRFRFSQIFDETASQDAVFNRSTRDIISSVMDGYNGCIMAYGQTGTGKTHTILGKRDGLLPSSMSFLFEKAQGGSYIFELSCLQIYMENLTDLFDPQNNNLQLRENKVGFSVVNAKWIRLRNFEDSIRIIEYAEARRLSSSTYMNPFSSRSHAIFTVRVINNQTMTSSNLFLVDLAGSERIKKSQAQGERLEEAISINRSLMALGKCIYGISENKNQHIPFRESKLTKLLQDTLTGNSKSAIIITISPDYPDVEESMSSLKFGQRAAKVYCAPKICRIPENEGTMHIDYLNDELTHLYKENEGLKSENKLLAEKIELLNMKEQYQNSSDNCEVKQLRVKPQSYSNQDLSRCENTDNKERSSRSNLSDRLYSEEAKNTLFKKGNIPKDIENQFYNEYYAMNMTDSVDMDQRVVLGDMENKLNCLDGNIMGFENTASYKNRVMQLENENEELKKKIETIEMDTFDQLKNTFDHVEGKFYQEVDNLKALNSKLQLSMYKSENELAKLKTSLLDKNRQNKNLEENFLNTVALGSITGNEWSTLCNDLYENCSKAKKNFYEKCPDNQYRKVFDGCYNDLYESINSVIDKINKKNIENEKSKYSIVSNINSRRARDPDSVLLRRNNSVDLNKRGGSFYNSDLDKKDIKRMLTEENNVKGLTLNNYPNSRNCDVKKEHESGYKIYETYNSVQPTLNDVEKDAVKSKLQSFSDCFIKRVLETTQHTNSFEKMSKGYESQRVNTNSKDPKILETPISKTQIEKQTLYYSNTSRVSLSCKKNNIELLNSHQKYDISIINELEKLLKSNTLLSLEKEYNISTLELMNLAYEDIFCKLINEINYSNILKNNFMRNYNFKDLAEKCLGENFNLVVCGWYLRQCSAKKIQKAVRNYISKNKFCNRKKEISGMGYFFKIKAGIGKEMIQLLFNNMEENMKTIQKSLTDN